MKRVKLLKKQDSAWNITTTHKFTFRHYQVDEYGNFYRDGILNDVKPDIVGSKIFMLIDDNGVRLRFKLHQIIMQTFEPKGLIAGLSVDHKNKDRLNNSLYNLRFATRQEQYSNRDNIICKYKRVKCLNNNVLYISCSEAEERLNLVKNTVSRVARGERKSIHGFEFKYV